MGHTEAGGSIIMHASSTVTAGLASVRPVDLSVILRARREVLKVLWAV